MISLFRGTSPRMRGQIAGTSPHSENYRGGSEGLPVVGGDRFYCPFYVERLYFGVAHDVAAEIFRLLFHDGRQTVARYLLNAGIVRHGVGEDRLAAYRAPVQYEYFFLRQGLVDIGPGFKVGEVGLQ